MIKAAREVFFLIGIDDDHRPVHTMRVCGDWAGAVQERARMAENTRYDRVLICREVESAKRKGS